MNNKPGGHLFDDFYKYYKFLADDTVDWFVSKPGEIIATLSDGSKIKYNASEHRYTSLSKNVTPEYENDFMTELECRREFAQRLRQCMRSRAMTQTELSELTDISQVTISKYVNGNALPGYYNISIIARALRCPVSDLMISE